jgi:hypothetical protein
MVEHDDLLADITSSFTFEDLVGDAKLLPLALLGRWQLLNI